MEDKELTFEELLKELDQTVRTLENREISLDDAVKGYTKGLELSKKCYDILEKNEKLVALKMTEDGLKEFKEEN